jgi:hypothetical protein
LTFEKLEFFGYLTNVTDRQAAGDLGFADACAMQLPDFRGV